MWPAVRRILHVPQPPPRQPYITLAPRRMAVSTVSSGPHAMVWPVGVSVIVNTLVWPLIPLCVDAQERLVQLLRVVEDGWSDLVLRPANGPAVRIHLIRRVPSERLEAIAGRIEEVDCRPACDPVAPRPVVDPRLVHRQD